MNPVPSCEWCQHDAEFRYLPKAGTPDAARYACLNHHHRYKTAILVQTDNGITAEDLIIEHRNKRSKKGFTLPRSPKPNTSQNQSA